MIDLNEANLLTVTEVANRVRVSKMTVYRLVHHGELKAIRVGRSFRIDERAVDRYLARSQETVGRFVDLGTFIPMSGKAVIDMAVKLYEAAVASSAPRTELFQEFLNVVHVYLEEQDSILETEAILGDPEAMAAIAEAEAER